MRTSSPSRSPVLTALCQQWGTPQRGFYRDASRQNPYPLAPCRSRTPQTRLHRLPSMLCATRVARTTRSAARDPHVSFNRLPPVRYRRRPPRTPLLARTRRTELSRDTRHTPTTKVRRPRQRSRAMTTHQASSRCPEGQRQLPDSCGHRASPSTFPEGAVEVVGTSCFAGHPLPHRSLPWEGAAACDGDGRRV